MTIQFWFKLRRNITMDGDLQLARLELETFLGDVQDIQVLESSHFPDMQKAVRAGQQGYQAQGDFSLLALLTRRLTFIQRIYTIIDDTAQIRALIVDEPTAIFHAENGKLYIETIPHYALFEYAEVIARKAKNPMQVKEHLTVLVDGLLRKQDNSLSSKLIDMVQSAQITSAPLSHGIHYYKAKFFPRMARAMLNITGGNRPPENLRVLDPFVGSGTTLLEASQMGMSNIGIDIDPLSVLISQAKLHILKTDSQTIEDAYFVVQQCLSDKPYQKSLFDNNHKNSTNESLSPISFPPWMMKNRKMTDELAAQLSDEIIELQLAVAQVDASLRDIFRVILSDAITRRIRFRFMGTGVGRFSLELSQTALKTLFLRALENQLHSLVAWEYLRDKLDLSFAESQVQKGDARYLSDLHNIDLIVTSPPYLPASSGRESYARARTPSLIALNMIAGDELDTLSDTSLGSMDDWNSQEESLPQVKQLVDWLENDALRRIKAQPTERYFHDMRQTFRAMKECLNDKGRIVLVSGRQSTFYRSSTREVLYSVPVADMLAEEAQQAGLQVDTLVHIPLRKANRNARPRSLDDYDETLILLSK